MNSVLLLTLRRLRWPLVLLVGVYAVGIVGLVLIPGVDAQGSPAPPMGFFHAFYFLSYTQHDRLRRDRKRRRCSTRCAGCSSGAPRSC